MRMCWRQRTVQGEYFWRSYCTSSFWPLYIHNLLFYSSRAKNYKGGDAYRKGLAWPDGVTLRSISTTKAAERYIFFYFLICSAIFCSLSRSSSFYNISLYFDRRLAPLNLWAKECNNRWGGTRRDRHGRSTPAALYTRSFWLLCLSFFFPIFFIM